MSRPGRRRTGAAVLVVTAALTSALVACSGGNDTLSVRASGTPSSTAAPASPTSPTSAAAPTSAASTATGTASAAAEPTTSSARATPSTRMSTTAATRTTTSTTTTPAATRWPKALGEPQQGQPAWGVYLAVAHTSSDAAIEKAVRQAAGVGYSAVVGDIACDGGAMEALKLDQFDYWTGATLYFRTQADARTFAASYTAEVAKPTGVAKVKVGCLD